MPEPPPWLGVGEKQATMTDWRMTDCKRRRKYAHQMKKDIAYMMQLDLAKSHRWIDIHDSSGKEHNIPGTGDDGGEKNKNVSLFPWHGMRMYGWGGWMRSIRAGAEQW